MEDQDKRAAERMTYEGGPDMSDMSHVLETPLKEQAKFASTNNGAGSETYPKRKIETREEALDAVETARPQSADWLRFDDDEATQRIQVFGQTLHETATYLSFDEQQKFVTETVALMAAVDAGRRFKGKDAMQSVSVYQEKWFDELFGDFKEAVSGGFKEFRDNEGKVASPDTTTFKEAVERASRGATDVIIKRFARSGESRTGTIQRLLTYVDAIEAQSKYAYIFGTTVTVPESLRSEVTAEEWKKFVGYVFAMPNGGWMGGIFGRTIAGQMVNPGGIGKEKALPVYKSNVGPYGRMVAEINRLGELEDNTEEKEQETEKLREETEKDKNEVRRWLNIFLKEEVLRPQIIQSELLHRT